MSDSFPATAARWTRWSISKSSLPGSQWHVVHDCGYVECVDLLANPNAAVEVERSHERTCP